MTGFRFLHLNANATGSHCGNPSSRAPSANSAKFTNPTCCGERIPRENHWLPLILDDALLRIDDHRRKGVYTLLGGMAPTRQVWILTCHRALADEIEGSLKVSRIDL